MSIKLLMISLLISSTACANSGSGVLQPTVVHVPQITTGRTARWETVERLAPSGRLKVTFHVDWFADGVLTDRLAKQYAVCFKAVERNITYCYKEIKL